MCDVVVKVFVRVVVIVFVARACTVWGDDDGGQSMRRPLQKHEQSSNYNNR